MLVKLASLVLFALLALGLAACSPAARPAESPPAPAAAKPAAKPAAQPAGRDAGSAAAKPVPPDYFAGKTLTLTVSLAAGGPTDVFARLIAQHLKKHVPGGPNVVVENRTGGGGLVGMNWVYQAARKDGLTIGVFGPAVASQVMSAEGLAYDVTKYQWVGSAVEGQVAFVHEGLGVRTPQDLPRASQEIVVGGLSPESPKDMASRTYLNLLGVRHKYVTGYPGNAEARLAFMRGEINYFEESMIGYTTSIIPLVNQGTVVPVGQRGVVKGGPVIRDPLVPDVPTYLEVVVAAKGDAVRATTEYRALEIVIRMSTMLRAIVYPPGVSPEIVETMRKAMVDTFADEEFQASAQQQLGFPLELVPGAQAQEASEDIVRRASEDSAAMEYLKRLTQDRG